MENRQFPITTAIRILSFGNVLLYKPGSARQSETEFPICFVAYLSKFKFGVSAQLPYGSSQKWWPTSALTISSHRDCKLKAHSTLQKSRLVTFCYCGIHPIWANMPLQTDLPAIHCAHAGLQESVYAGVDYSLKQMMHCIWGQWCPARGPWRCPEI